MDTLLPVIVGGIIGLFGGLVGPPLAHWLNEGASAKRRRAEKFEELIVALYAYDHWLAVLRGIRAFGHDIPEPPSPFPEARAIAVIYFPDLDNLLTKVEVSAGLYVMWMLNAARKRLENAAASELSAGHKEAYEPYAIEFRNAVEMLKRYAERAFG